MQTGQDALRRLTDPGFSLVILDLGLPDLDGLDVLENLRQRGSAVPVLVLSARGRIGDRVKGLNLGADDYLGKSFAFEELLARVRANLRPRAAVSPTVLQVGSIHIDLLQREVTAGGRTVSLSARELSLLKAFAGHPAKSCPGKSCCPWPGAWTSTRTNLVDMYVGYPRRKLGEPIVETVRGAGYCLQA